MRTKQFGLFFTAVFALIFVMSALSAATLAEWPLASSVIPINVNSNLTATNLVAGTGVSDTTTGGPGTFEFVTNGVLAEDWTNATTVDTNDYFQVTLAPQTGFSFTITGISFDVDTNTANTINYSLQWDDNSGFTSPSVVSTGAVSTTITNVNNTGLNLVTNQGQTIFLRVFGFTATNASTQLSVKNLNLQGTVTAVTPSTTVPPEATACSAIGNPGQLEVRKISFQNNGMGQSTFGKDDEWFPLEEIEVEIELKNNGNDDVDDVSLEWGLWDTKAGDWIIDLDEDKDFNLKDGDKENLIVTFTIDSDLDVDFEDLTDGNNYRLYVVATGTVDITTSPETCVSDFEPASIIIESDFIVINNVQIPEVVQCGENVQVSATVWNIGDRDQDEVSIEVFGRESALGLTKTLDVGDMNAFDKKPVSFAFNIPRNLNVAGNLEDKFYALTFQVKDEDGDVYKNDFDDDDSEFVVPFKVEGNCGTAGTGAVTVTASLVSGGIADQEMVVKATVTNNEIALKTYKIGAAGFTEWADSASVDQSTLVLNAGQSGDVIFNLAVNEDASGSYTFFIEVTSGSEVVRQPVSVTIEPKSRFGITGNVFSGDNWPIWTIGFLNLILVIIIIVVAVRIAKK